ncbi:MAG: hypothetical protein HW380_1654 [Magnetococcales bacterium]|nr:hypothetical protein [Magnetococcales bacterium]HIJ82647.1 hypothetical protein [Magnetococcales bacterium]
MDRLPTDLGQVFEDLGDDSCKDALGMDSTRRPRGCLSLAFAMAITPMKIIQVSLETYSCL